MAIPHVLFVPKHGGRVKGTEDAADDVQVLVPCHTIVACTCGSIQQKLPAQPPDNHTPNCSTLTPKSVPDCRVTKTTVCELVTTGLLKLNIPL